MYAENMMFVETLVQNDSEPEIINFWNYLWDMIDPHAFINTTDSTNEFLTYPWWSRQPAFPIIMMV